MNKSDRPLTVFVILACLLLAGIVAENIRTVYLAQNPGVAIDVSQVKATLNKAGVKWQEAKYWKKL